MARKATSQDVADLAGVSRSAVSLVLNGRGDGNISPANQRAILEAARQLNYSPNAVALSLRSRRTRCLGVLIWGGPRTATWQVLYAALRSATQFGHQLLIMDTDGTPSGEAYAIEVLADRQVEGFLVIAPEPSAYLPPETILASPAVLVNCADPKRQVTSVAGYPDDPAALAAVGDQAVRLLLEEILHRRGSVGRLVVERADVLDPDEL